MEFTDEEGYGKYLDLHECYEKYINLKGIEVSKTFSNCFYSAVYEIYRYLNFIKRLYCLEYLKYYGLKLTNICYKTYSS